MVVLVDVQDGQAAEQNRFEHGWVRGRGSEREQQRPEIRRQLGERERAGPGGVKEEGERFDEEGEERRGGVWSTCPAEGGVRGEIKVGGLKRCEGEGRYEERGGLTRLEGECASARSEGGRILLRQFSQGRLERASAAFFRRPCARRTYEL